MKFVDLGSAFSDIFKTTLSTDYISLKRKLNTFHNPNMDTVAGDFNVTCLYMLKSCSLYMRILWSYVTTLKVASVLL